jgi:hypothetical protein
MRKFLCFHEIAIGRKLTTKKMVFLRKWIHDVNSKGNQQVHNFSFHGAFSLETTAQIFPQHEIDFAA